MTTLEERPKDRLPEPMDRLRGRFNISAWSIEHPYVVIAVFTGIVAMALAVVLGNVMPRRMMPYVESPMVGIVTMMPGLSAQEMETYISKPIEERMTDIRGARYIRSTSQDGLSIVSLEFPYGTDMRKATSDVQSLMNAVQADLPQTGANLKPSWVLPIDPLNIPILSISVTGDANKGWSPVALRQFAENQAVAAIKQVGDVQSVEVYGGQKRQLRVVVDRDKLAAYGFSILDVRDAIDRNSVAKPAGLLTAGPTETIVRVADLAQDAGAVGNYPLGARDGRVVYVKDVADVTDDVREQRSGYEFVDGARHTIEGEDEDAVELAVIQNPAAGSPPVIAAVRDQLDRLQEDHPGLHFRVAYDNAHFVGILFRNTAEELIAAVFLCGLAVLFFIGHWRGTTITMITIPVSMATAILLMAPFGFSLNSSTLIGLLVSIGRLVDDSVIDIHSVERHLRMGKRPREATVDGITEVRLAVAASTLMLVLALLPLVVCGGITQLMFVGLVYPIIFGLIASFVVSLTLTAVLASRLLKPAEEIHDTWMERRLLAPVQRRLEALDDRYERWVRVLLRNKMSVIAAAICTIVLGFGFYQFIGSEMMPLADVGQAYGVLEMAPGSSYAQTKEAATAVDRLFLQQPEIEKVSTEIGSEPGGTYFTGYAMNQINTATMMITLKDKDERRRDVWQVIDRVRDQALRTIPNIRRLQIKEMGSDVMASSQAPVTILVSGQDPVILSKLADQVAEIAGSTPGAYQVGTSWDVEKPTYTLDVDPRRAAELGLTPADVADQAYYAMGGALADEFYRLPNIRQDTINIRYQDDQRRSVDDLLQMPITGKDGVQAPLKTLATVTPQLAPTIIEHDGLRRTVSVLAYYRKGGPPSMDLAMSIIGKASANLNFPPGYSMEVRGDMTQMMDSFARLLRGLEIALLLIFLVLIAQFGGLLAPLQMVLSIPLELSGVFFGLWLAHQAFSSVSIMAIIVLSGMDITTAILLIDQIMRRRRESQVSERSHASSERSTPAEARDSAIALACRDRLRPILMTALITIITMLPVALAPRTGMDAYQPLGTVIVAGLTVGTLLSLMVIPVMHAVVDDAGSWIGRRRGAHSVGLTVVVLVSFVAVARPVHADSLPVVNGPLSLADAQSLALRNNPSVLESAADASSAAAAVEGARAMTRPGVSATTYGTIGDSANIVTSAPSVAPSSIVTVGPQGFADQNVTLMAPILTGGRLQSGVDAAQYQLQAASLSAQRSGDVQDEAVTEAYASALAAEAIADAARARLTAEDEQVRVTSQAVQVGRMAPVDLAREQAEQADAQKQVADAGAAASTAIAELKGVLGVAQTSDIDLTDNLDVLSKASSGSPDSVATVVAEADSRSDVRAADERVASAHRVVDEARGAYAPQVYADAMGDATAAQNGSRTGYTIGLAASIPLVDGGSRRSVIDEATASLDRTEAEARATRIGAEKAAAEAWNAVEASDAEVDAASAGVAAAQQASDLATLRYNAGKGVDVERLDALSALTRARSSLAQAQAARIVDQARLRLAVGAR